MTTDEDKREENNAESAEGVEADSEKYSGVPPPGLVRLHEVYLPFLRRVTGSSSKPFLSALALIVIVIVLGLIVDRRLPLVPRWLPVALISLAASYMGICISVALMTSVSDGAVWVKKYRELHPDSKSDPKSEGPPDSNQPPETKE